MSGFGPSPGRSLTSRVSDIEKPDLVFLIETKLRSNEWDVIKKKVKLPNALVVESRSRKGGLVLLSPRELKVEIKSFSIHHIEACISQNLAPPWRFVGFYGHHETRNRRHSWNLMTLLNVLSSLPIIFVGDFNEVLDRSEHVSHRRQRPTWQMENFRQVIKDCGIFDVE
ncbi:hypothetical protein LIER_34003 [Lithospermum erythrorhizon]|uniref:Endonuclease/exonuclease/phosphatase domain-containing protein n=1 Tax=Lithospermum erythrorhizon TaxID=34254 RepID=A0AAV3S0Q5_LITER